MYNPNVRGHVLSPTTSEAQWEDEPTTSDNCLDILQVRDSQYAAKNTSHPHLMHAIRNIPRSLNKEYLHLISISPYYHLETTGLRQGIPDGPWRCLGGRR